MEEIKWLGHSSFKIKGKGKILYIDPYRIAVHEAADFIFITHPHARHFSFDDILKISGKKTNIYAPADCDARLEQLPGWSIAMRPGETHQAGSFTVTAIPAYNTRGNRHPADAGWIGFLIDFDDMKVYHSGDTDLIPEMKMVIHPDYALLPVSGGNVMNAADAAKAAELIKPRIAIPMHYSDDDGTAHAAEMFRGLYGGTTRILKATC